MNPIGILNLDIYIFIFLQITVRIKNIFSSPLKKILHYKKILQSNVLQIEHSSTVKKSVSKKESFFTYDTNLVLPFPHMWINHTRILSLKILTRISPGHENITVKFSCSKKGNRNFYSRETESLHMWEYTSIWKNFSHVEHLC